MEERKRKDREKRARSRNKHRTPNKSDLPTTPNSKTKLVSNIIESATPTTSSKLRELNIKKASERSAENDIVNAAAAGLKKAAIRRELLPKLATSNKKAVAMRLGISRNLFYYKSQKGQNPKTALDTINKVREFYFREEISTIYPNKTKSGKIMRAMKFTKARTYKLFVEEYGALTKQTTFYKLRPRDIKLRKKAQYLQCLCDPCDNVQIISKTVRKSMLKDGLQPPDMLVDDYELAKASVCDFDRYECLDNKCAECRPHEVFDEVLKTWLENEDGEVMTWTIWERADDEYKGKVVKKLMKVRKSGVRADLYNDLKSQLAKLPSYALHKKNCVAQLYSYRMCKESLRPDEAVVVVDFAENYVCRQAAEAQASYYGRNSTTVHPMVIIFPNDSEISRDYFDIISNDLNHDGSAVKVFISKLSNHITKTYPHIKTLKIWSDGCGVQYKSRLPMLNISDNFFIPQKVIWNFFGSRHGKNESDGESAVVKSALEISTRAELLTMTHPIHCYEYLISSTLIKPQNPTARRHFAFVDREDIEQERFSLPAVICAIPNVRQIHQICGSGGKVVFSRLSCYCTSDCRHGLIDSTTFNFPG